MKGIIFDIKGFAVHDGPGIRTTVFFKGCPLRCPWCHNPESYSMEPQISIKEVSQENRTGREEEIIGEWVDSSEVMDRIKKDRIFYDQSNGGVTFSGGEPLLQPEFLTDLLIQCKSSGFHTALDTCGHADWDTLSGVVDLVDLFLYDIKLIDSRQHREFTGVSNKKIIANLRRLSEKGKKIVIRFVVIPGITDTDENLQGMAELLSSLNGVEGIDILPYHKMGSGKHKKLGLGKNSVFKVPADSQIKRVREAFLPLKVNIKTGG